ncbi:hypothetical protein CEP53_010044, partial [Fusarium sp. AF-6]
MRNGRVVSILNHPKELEESCKALQVLADTAVATDQAAAVSRVVGEKCSRASDSGWQALNRDNPSGLPGQDSSSVPPQTASGGYTIPRRGRFSSGSSMGPSGEWLRDMPSGAKDEQFPWAESPYKTPTRSRDSSFATVVPDEEHEDSEATISDPGVESAPAPVPFPAPNQA